MVKVVARQTFPPIQNWTTDISDLERIWKENEIGLALRGEFIVTTVGRFKYRARGRAFTARSR